MGSGSLEFSFLREEYSPIKNYGCCFRSRGCLPEGRHPRLDYWTVTVKVAVSAESEPDIPVTVTV